MDGCAPAGHSAGGSRWAIPDPVGSVGSVVGQEKDNESKTVTESVLASEGQLCETQRGVSPKRLPPQLRRRAALSLERSGAWLAHWSCGYGLTGCGSETDTETGKVEVIEGAARTGQKRLNVNLKSLEAKK